MEKLQEADKVPGLLRDPGDGYRAAQSDVEWVPILRQELLDRLNSTRWWDKRPDWLQVRIDGLPSCNWRLLTETPPAKGI